MVYLWSVENVITLGKLICLLFCLPSSLLLFVETLIEVSCPTFFSSS